MYSINNKEKLKKYVINVKRVTKVTKGGKKISFRAIVVMGNKMGKIGLGIAKATDTKIAIEKAKIISRKNLFNFPLTKKLTIPHNIYGIYGAAKIFMKPLSEGSGIIAGETIKNILEISGIKNITAKQLGSNSIVNNAYASINALKNLITNIRVNNFNIIHIRKNLIYDKN